LYTAIIAIHVVPDSRRLTPRRSARPPVAINTPSGAPSPRGRSD
jgi:hypothetical protein